MDLTIQGLLSRKAGVVDEVSIVAAGVTASPGNYAPSCKLFILLATGNAVFSSCFFCTKNERPRYLNPKLNDVLVGVL